jgi:hypothetical protein
VPGGDVEKRYGSCGPKPIGWKKRVKETKEKVKSIEETRKKTEAGGECHRDEESTSLNRKEESIVIRLTWTPGKMNKPLLLM